MWVRVVSLMFLPHFDVSYDLGFTEQTPGNIMIESICFL